MNKGIESLILILLLSMPAYPQMHGGMMGPEGMREQRGANRSQGLQVYDAFRRSCHRTGGNVIDPDLPLKDAPQFSDFKTFLKFIRAPRMPDGSHGAMPAFPPARISDQEAQALYQYLDDWLDARQ